MPDLNDMAIFARVVQARSFSAAARRIGASKSRMSKAVARLERGLGARLIHRASRGLALTEAGEAFYRHCSRMLEEAAKASHAVSAHHAAPQGLLRLAAAPAFGATQLAEALPGFLARHRHIRVHLSLGTRPLEAMAAGYDLAILAGDELPPWLAARRLGATARIVCAAPSYLRAKGTPLVPEELAAHDCLHTGAAWPLGNASHAVQGPLCADDERTLFQAARAGLGIALLPDYLVAEDLRCGRLVALLPAWPALPEPIHALRMPGAFVAPKVRALIDYLCERFGAADRNADLRESVEVEMQK